MKITNYSAMILAAAGVGIGASHAVAFDSSPFAAQMPQDARKPCFHFAHESILGTSFDLLVDSPCVEDAINCQRQVLAEIERLRAILSTYDPASEISRVRRGGPLRSDELAQVIAGYDLWSKRSDGAIEINMAGVIDLWKRAMRQNSLPSQVELLEALDAPGAWNIDALGKGFIIDRAVEVARRIVPAGALNIGGDIRVWGDRSWKIGVSDPRNPAENAPLLTSFDLYDSAVASSGGYARFFTVDGRRYSHVIDPRTGWPVDHVTSATIIAPDCMTANALSTAATVLGARDGQALAERFGAGGFGIVGDAHQVWTGGSIPAPAAPPAWAQNADAPAAAWPKDFQVAVEIALKDPNAPSTMPAAAPAPPRGGRGARGGGGRGYKRPYVAVWVHDASQKVVRTIAVWGTEPRWVPELSYWWNAAANTPVKVDAITRATRPPGKYTVAWDGKDDRGQPVPAGSYTITVEINREHGRHVKETATIECGQLPQTATLKATAETDPAAITFGPRSQ